MPTKVVYEPRPRYVVEIADQFVDDARFQGVSDTTTIYPTHWEFNSAHHSPEEAKREAEKLARENSYVRVIDRGVK